MWRHTTRLPSDLELFLREERQLIYDPLSCEAGKVSMIKWRHLKLERFPVETRRLDNYKEDPKYPELNSYLVLGVDLLCDCVEYDSRGLLLWLPLEEKYGIWDSTNCQIHTFAPEVTWTRIVTDPSKYINSGWSYINRPSVPMTRLVPWPNHPYHHRQVYDPMPMDLSDPVYSERKTNE
jgi:hypothetical protein